MTQIIARHSGQFHIDDTVGVGLLLTWLRSRGIGAQVVTISPQDGESIHRLRESGAFFVDVGGACDPDRFWFDHHHDARLACAAVLVAEKIGAADFLESDAARFMSIKDVCGIEEAISRTGHKPRLASKEAERGILALDMNDDLAGLICAQCFAAKRETTYEDFIMNLWHSISPEQRAIAMSRVKDQDDQAQKALASCRLVNMGQVRIAFTTEVVHAPLAFNKWGVDFVVARNAMNPAHTSITKKRGVKCDLGKAGDVLGVKTLFTHNTGFLTVLDVAPEKINVRRLSALVD